MEYASKRIDENDHAFDIPFFKPHYLYIHNSFLIFKNPYQN